MEQKRTLLWLSADRRLDRFRLLLGDQWHLSQVNPGRSMPRLPTARGCASIGVCDLASLAPGQYADIDQWLEHLPSSLWLAMVHPDQLNHPQARRLIQDYCQDYHTLPIDEQRLHHSLGHLWGMARLTSTEASPRAASYQDFVLDGSSQPIRRTRSLLRRFAATNEPVLIYGESGTGREAAARFVHRESHRRHQPLVIVNCAALPPSLTQSELFGHERGAFTHALKARKGRIEAADGGTLVLAGADELNLEQQSSILRFLEDGQVEPIGSNRPIQVDVRIIATCTTPLEKLMQAGRFREDVLYRLGNLTVTMPPLRERPEDMPALVKSFLDTSTNPKHWIDNATLIAMAWHHWPGNLRELQNRLSQAVLLSRSLRIQPQDMGLLQASASRQHDRYSLEAFRARADREAITTSLSLTHQNISAAARLLKISRVSFYRLLDKHQLTPPSVHTPKHTDPDRGHGETS